MESNKKAVTIAKFVEESILHVISEINKLNEKLDQCYIKYPIVSFEIYFDESYNIGGKNRIKFEIEIGDEIKWN